MRVFSLSEHVMATKPITDRQQYWLDHLKRATAPLFGVDIALILMSIVKPLHNQAVPGT
ncbi:MAG: hypothetical protein AAGI44_08360 [Pseudomonadota bacterium]